jgi:hypothetical protein
LRFFLCAGLTEDRQNIFSNSPYPDEAEHRKKSRTVAHFDRNAAKPVTDLVH